MPIFSLVLLALALGVYFVAFAPLPPTTSVIGLLAAWTTWPLAFFGALRLSGAGARDLRRRGTAAWSALFPTLVLVVEALFALLGLDWWLGTSAGLVIAASTFGLAAKLWFLPLRPVFALRAALADAERARAAADELARQFETSRSGPFSIARRRRANRALAAVAVLSEARCWQEAERVLDSFDMETLDPLRRSMLQASRATVSIYLGKWNAAWSALKDAGAHAKDPALLRVVALNDALLSALDGHGEEALERLEAMPAFEDPRHRRAWLIAKSHALAGTGKPEEARACLLELATLSKDSLARVVELSGPASSLAGEIQADQAPLG
jgi:hypothetical protein